MFNRLDPLYIFTQGIGNADSCVVALRRQSSALGIFVRLACHAISQFLPSVRREVEH